MSDLPTETSLVDEAWYSADGVRLAKYHADVDRFTVPGVGERSIGGSLLRFGPVAKYEPPMPEPMNFGAIVEDDCGFLWFRIGWVLPEGVSAWYRTGCLAVNWDELAQPVTLRAAGLPDSNQEKS